MAVLKKDCPPTLTEFNKIINEISHENSVIYLSMVDIKFNDISSKILLFNEPYPPIFEKNKKMDSYERLALHLLSIMVRNEEKEKINSLPHNSKTL